VTGAQFTVDGPGPDPLVTARGELDLAARDELRAVLAPLTGVVTLDLAQVTFLDSSTIGVLVGVHNRLAAEGGALRLRRPQDMPRRALELVGLEDWIDC
jgi:anti-sigma B factor antagonist